MKAHAKTWVMGPSIAKTTSLGTPVVTSVRSGNDTVTKGAIIQGDYKSPNNWSYTTDWQEDYFGQVSDYWAYNPVGPVNPKTSVLYRKWYLDTLNTGAGVIPVPWSEAFPTWLYNAALSNLNEKVRGGLDLSIDLAEAGKTMKMFSVTDQLTQFAKGLGRKLPGIGSLIANSWLQWQYGWRPLIGTVYDAHDESVRYVLNKLKRFRAGSVEKFSDRSRNVTVMSRSMRTKDDLSSCLQSCRFNIWFEIPSEDWSIERWTSLNPASIAWELMPYSFVVDWVLNIGGYLRSLETALLYRTGFKSGYVSWLSSALMSSTLDTTAHNYSGGSGLYSYKVVRYAAANSTAMRRYITFKRTKLLSYPLPYYPSVKAKLGSERLLSAAALLTQLLTRK